MAHIRSESAVQLREAMGRLPEDSRRVIRLRRIEELATEQVAEAMDRSPNSVRILYFRALKLLREEMEK